MTREIKFRAWDIRRRRMFKVIKVNFYNKSLMRLGETHRFEQDIILMQFTGLKDKNGKEIFEGDILMMKHDRGKWGQKGRVLVVWEYCEFCAEKIDEDVVEDYESLGNYRFDDYDIEVIGNKFENPELLK